MGIEIKDVGRAPRKRTTTRRRKPRVRAAVHKAGRRIRQAAKGQRGTQVARRRNLGPMGALGDDVIIEIRLNESLKNFPRELSMALVKRSLRHTIYDPLRDYMEKKIPIWAPSDTEALRESMENSIRKGKPTIDQFSTTSPFLVILGTPGIPYAGPVNRMPQSWLRHPKKGKTNIGRQGDPLFDPTSRKGWYNLLLLNGRNQARKFYNDFLKNDIVPVLRQLQQVGLIKNAWNAARTLFKVKFR